MLDIFYNPRQRTRLLVPITRYAFRIAKTRKTDQKFKKWQNYFASSVHPRLRRVTGKDRFQIRLVKGCRHSQHQLQPSTWKNKSTKFEPFTETTIFSVKSSNREVPNSLFGELCLRNRFKATVPDVNRNFNSVC